GCFGQNSPKTEIFLYFQESVFHHSFPLATKPKQISFACFPEIRPKTEPLLPEQNFGLGWGRLTHPLL
ncbi:hypothetical protein, partial [Rufibacter ruber]|uniref:hypothetical protein n=1 Tax=Rufibacter ruber TaxID=1783499 RepID=UPI0019D33A85